MHDIILVPNHEWDNIHLLIEFIGPIQGGPPIQSISIVYVGACIHHVRVLEWYNKLICCILYHVEIGVYWVVFEIGKVCV